jgi:hypothetical protein
MQGHLGRESRKKNAARYEHRPGGDQVIVAGRYYGRGDFNPRYADLNDGKVILITNFEAVAGMTNAASRGGFTLSD